MVKMGTGGLLLRRLRAKVSKTPTNFSWIYRGKLAASGIPSSRDQVEWLARRGMNSVLTLTEAPLPAEWFEGMNVRLKHIPMKDHEVPPVRALDEAATYIDEEVKSGRTILVHCLAGKGRTGSALAAYLMKTKGISAKEASELLRKTRPGSVESRQEASLREYEKSLKGS
jgi:atypical dual specificity phosphatase